MTERVSRVAKLPLKLRFAKTKKTISIFRRCENGAIPMNRSNYQKEKTMKFKLSSIISMIMFALFAFAANAQAQTAQGPPNASKVPHFQYPRPSLVGTITFSAPSDARLNALNCSDFTVVVGTDAKTAAGTGVSIPYLQVVASAKAVSKGKGQCHYVVSSMPVGKPFKVELRITNQKKFPCDRVELASSYLPLKTLETITFKADQVEERNFTVKSISCTIIK
jgi:hypothetical protein